VASLNYQLRELARELEAVRMGLPAAQQTAGVSSASVIAADLLALPVEFEALHIDLKEKTVSVDTPSIVLEEVDLGPFQIVLRWERIGAGRAYLVKALEPNRARSKSNVTHPHVEDHNLCEGAGADAIRSALTSGRLLDFFLLIRQILETYNSRSPFVPLAEWGEGDDGSTECCHDCGYDMSSDDGNNCESCDARICMDCTVNCQGCNRYVCSECSSTCSECERHFCQACLTEDEHENLFCETCLQQRDQPTDEDNPTPAPAADAVCLGETAAAA
jgi:hypothetical protein